MSYKERTKSEILELLTQLDTDTQNLVVSVSKVLSYKPLSGETSLDAFKFLDDIPDQDLGRVLKFSRFLVTERELEDLSRDIEKAKLLGVGLEDILGE